MSDTANKALSGAVLRLLRPLVRILLRYGVSHRTFSDLAKWVYVDVATREFGIEGRKQTTSRVAIITGLTRKEVARQQQLAGPDKGAEERYNRAAIVISSWRNNRRFLDARRRPRSLPVEGRGASFSELVKQSGADVPVRAVLDELIRVGAVKTTRDGRVRLAVRAYIPGTDEEGKIDILGVDTADLVSTIGHNISPNVTEPMFQRKVAYDNLPDDVLPEFRKLAGRQAQTLLERLNTWLASRDRDCNPDVEGTGKNRAGIGIFYFEGNDDNG